MFHRRRANSVDFVIQKCYMFGILLKTVSVLHICIGDSWFESWKWNANQIISVYNRLKYYSSITITITITTTFIAECVLENRTNLANTLKWQYEIVDIKIRSYGANSRSHETSTTAELINKEEWIFFGKYKFNSTCFY